MSEAPDGSVRVEHHGAARQYEIYVDDRRADLAGSRDEDGTRMLTHTEVDPEFGDQGRAGRLAKRAFEDARAEGRRVASRCSYLAKYAERHPEYGDLVDKRASRRRRDSGAGGGEQEERG